MRNRTRTRAATSATRTRTRTILFLLAAAVVGTSHRSVVAFAPTATGTARSLPLRSTVAASDDAATPATAAAAAAVPERASKYPTRRGETVDSRKIIDYVASADGGGSSSSFVGGSSASGEGSPLLALRLNHILFASKELAKLGLGKLTSAEWSFPELAQQVSNCAETRADGGAVGWVNVGEVEAEVEVEVEAIVEVSKDDDETVTTDTNPNEHLNLILPPSARIEILNKSTKPGDIVLVESSRGVHLVQIADVMVDVRRLSSVRERGSTKRNKNRKEEAQPERNPATPGKGKQQRRLRGVLGGALNAEEQLLDGAAGAFEAEKKKIDLTYKIETMGCQMNRADSERIEGQLMSLGIRPLTEDEENGTVGDDDDRERTAGRPESGTERRRKKREKKQPDVIVLNTCSIRDHAEQKVYSYIGPHAKRKREGEDVTIVVAGCVAQQEGQNLLRRIPEVDLVMGPQYANRIADLLEDVSYGNQVVATEAAHVMEDSTKPRRSSGTCGWVNVIYGCNERCTYCIVPTTRGVEQSRPAESIVAEVEDLVSRGFKEVTLLGQNIDAYGRDMIPKRKFSDLLRTVGSVPGLDRLRFVTSHPRYMSLGVVDAVAETPSACEYFHVPFQSGSNEILRAMGRGHTREKFLGIVDRIRQRLPDAAITADVIVAFPGETEEDFQDTLDLMETVVFDNVNTAAYSPRPNTPAATWENQLSDEIKQDRLRRINVLNLKHASERRARMMGRTVTVLIEERNVKVPTQVMGRTTHGYIVYVDGDIDELRGKLVDVEIDTCQTYYLAGQMVQVVAEADLVR